jgi:methionyl-tRNA formyltransferase
MSAPGVPGREIRLLVLTMPGFGIETLRRLDLDPRWPTKSLLVGMIGRPPGPSRWLAACMRLRWRNLRHPRAWLADSALAGMEARRWLASRSYESLWLEQDADVRRVRAAWNPELTLTITSRIIFSELTLNSCSGDWLNVHPGLLPRYAGASPGPYMFFHGRAGCTIHRMSVRIDAGPVVDIAEIDGDLGLDGGDLLYERLPRLAAERIIDVLRRWRSGTLESRTLAPGTLQNCSSAQLRRDRLLDWSWEASGLARWVSALMPFAPAYFVDRGGRRREVRAALIATGPVAGDPGTVLEKRGEHVRVACRDGSVWLECCARPRLRVGDRLAGAAPAQS